MASVKGSFPNRKVEKKEACPNKKYRGSESDERIGDHVGKGGSVTCPQSESSQELSRKRSPEKGEGAEKAGYTRRKRKSGLPESSQRLLFDT
jgi:hypothetical protein